MSAAALTEMDEHSTILMVYMTAANREEAEKIAHILVMKKVVACVNILGGITSIYEWKGSIEHASEIAMVAKTTTGQYAELERLVAAAHSYECPCIVAWPIEQGYPAYLDWVRESAR